MLTLNRYPASGKVTTLLRIELDQENTFHSRLSLVIQTWSRRRQASSYSAAILTCSPYNLHILASGTCRLAIESLSKKPLIPKRKKRQEARHDNSGNRDMTTAATGSQSGQQSGTRSTARMHREMEMEEALKQGQSQPKPINGRNSVRLAHQRHKPRQKHPALYLTTTTADTRPRDKTTRPRGDWTLISEEQH